MDPSALVYREGGAAELLKVRCGVCGPSCWAFAWLLSRGGVGLRARPVLGASARAIAAFAAPADARSSTQRRPLHTRQLATSHPAAAGERRRQYCFGGESFQNKKPPKINISGSLARCLSDPRARARARPFHPRSAEDCEDALHYSSSDADAGAGERRAGGAGTPSSPASAKPGHHFHGSSSPRQLGSGAAKKGGAPPPGMPAPWVVPLLQSCYFGPCERHRHHKKNEVRGGGGARSNSSFILAG